MRKVAGYLLLLMAIAGISLGVLVLAPAFQIAGEAGGYVGLIAGMYLSLCIPGLWKELNDARPGNLSGERLDLRHTFIHPTQLPSLIGCLWFLVLGSGLVLIDRFFPEIELKVWDARSIALFLPVPFLFGLNAFLMTLREEYIRFPGYLVRGKSALFFGILGMIFWWGRVQLAHLVDASEEMRWSGS